MRDHRLSTYWIEDDETTGVNFDHETRSAFLGTSDYLDHVANAEGALHMPHLDLARIGPRHRHINQTVIAEKFDSSKRTLRRSGDHEDSIVNGKRMGSGEDMQMEASDGNGEGGIVFGLERLLGNAVCAVVAFQKSGDVHQPVSFGLWILVFHLRYNHYEARPPRMFSRHNNNKVPFLQRAASAGERGRPES
jgi:hypothetical protein